MTEIERSIIDLKNGKDSALHFFYDKFKRLLFRIACDHGMCIEDAEERVNDTFMKLITAIDKFTYKDDSSFIGWLRKVHTNGVLLFLRDSKQISTGPLEEGSGSATQDCNEVVETDEHKKRMQIIADEFQKLDEKNRILLTMRAKGYRYREIGDCLQIDPNTLKVRHKRVSDKLLDNLTGKFKAMKMI